jgi:hypothetical protein
MTSRFKSSLLAIAVTSAASLSLGAPQAAHAQAKPDANFGTACSSSAVNGTTAVGTITEFLEFSSKSPNGGCLIGDKLFKLTEYNFLNPETTQLSFTKVDDLRYSVTAQFGAGMPTNATFNYSATITPYPGAQAQNGFSRIISSGTSSLEEVDYQNWAVTTSGSFPDLLLNQNNPTKATNLNLTQATFAIGNKVTASFNGPQQITNTIYQKSASSVPGPLPILGAGLAFGYSRKLRSRIKSSTLA